MVLPIDNLKSQYQLLGVTIAEAIRRSSFKQAKPEQESLVLQGMYLFGVRTFEAFLEGQMIYLCSPDANWGPKTIGNVQMRYVRKIEDRSHRRIKGLISVGRNYVDYLPYDETLKKARVLFARGRPFSLLDSNMLEVIRRTSTVRNLIAHESEHSLRVFKKTVCARYPLQTGFQSAIGYILHEHKKGVPMITQDLASLLEIANFLA